MGQSRNPILADSVPLTERLNFEMFSTFKLGQVETIAFQRGAQAMRASRALAPIDWPLPALQADQHLHRAGRSAARHDQAGNVFRGHRLIGRSGDIAV